jgi:hypothetical protein
MYVPEHQAFLLVVDKFSALPTSGSMKVNIQLEALDKWYSTFFVRLPPNIIYLQLCTPEVVGV